MTAQKFIHISQKRFILRGIWHREVVVTMRFDSCKFFFPYLVSNLYSSHMVNTADAQPTCSSCMRVGFSISAEFFGLCDIVRLACVRRAGYDINTGLPSNQQSSHVCSTVFVETQVPWQSSDLLLRRIQRKICFPRFLVSYSCNVFEERVTTTSICDG